MEKARVADNKPVRYNKLVVTGVSDQWEDDELKEEAGWISSDGSADA